MPKLSKIKPPTAKRVEGMIYTHEIMDAKNHAKLLLKKCKDRMQRIKVYIKDTHTGESTIKYVQPVKH